MSFSEILSSDISRPNILIDRDYSCLIQVVKKKHTGNKICHFAILIWITTVHVAFAFLQKTLLSPCLHIPRCCICSISLSTVSLQILPQYIMEMFIWRMKYTKYFVIVSGSYSVFSFLSHYSSNTGILHNFYLKDL